MSEDGRLGVGLLGLGVVGGGVARFLLEHQSSAHAVSVPPVTLRSILVRDAGKPRSLSVPSGLLTTDPAAVLGDAGTHLIVEVMGGEYPCGRLHPGGVGPGQARGHGQQGGHGQARPGAPGPRGGGGRAASVRGQRRRGHPHHRPLAEDLLANDISSIHAIINGTTNFILTKMAREGMGFEEALLQAQELGYAEADPSNDVEGVDAAYKLAILSSLAFRTRVHASDVFVEGITRLQAVDFQYAQELGYAIKLLAIGRKDNGALQVRVHPTLIPAEDLMAKVDGADNAIQVRGDLVGSVVFSGPGAGSSPTTSAVLGDVLAVCRHVAAQAAGGGPAAPPAASRGAPQIESIAALRTQYYLRLTVQDRAGVLAQIASVMGQHGISIASVIQKDADLQAGTAEIVITTHPSREVDMQEALARFRELEVVIEANNLIRVEAD